VIKPLALVILVLTIGSAACSSANPAGPSAMGSAAIINGAIVADEGSASKHNGGGTGSSTVPGLVVTVAGTTISAVVDSADQFTLRDVPSGTVQLVFTAPNLSGSVALSDVQGGDTLDVGVVVSGATVVLDSQSRRRGSDTELEGRIRALPPTTAPHTFIVAGRHVTTTDTTRYFARGDERVGFDNLQVGMRVLVNGQRRGDTLVATSVKMHLQ